MPSSPNPRDSALLIRAAAFAAERHRRQRRRDAEASPYINHPIALADVLANEGGIDDPVVLCAALLHDTIEDTETTAAEIEAAFGPRIAAVVIEVSDDRGLSKSERKRLQIEHAARASREPTRNDRIDCRMPSDCSTKYTSSPAPDQAAGRSAHSGIGRFARIGRRMLVETWVVSSVFRFRTWSLVSPGAVPRWRNAIEAPSGDSTNEVSALLFSGRSSRLIRRGAPLPSTGTRKSAIRRPVPTGRSSEAPRGDRRPSRRRTSTGRRSAGRTPPTAGSARSAERCRRSAR